MTFRDEKEKIPDQPNLRFDDPFRMGNDEGISRYYYDTGWSEALKNWICPGMVLENGMMEEDPEIKEKEVDQADPADEWADPPHEDDLD
jgi:hypothetical protein